MGGLGPQVPSCALRDRVTGSRGRALGLHLHFEPNSPGFCPGYRQRACDTFGFSIGANHGSGWCHAQIWGHPMSRNERILFAN